jgi:hypothetical protein
MDKVILELRRFNDKMMKVNGIQQEVDREETPSRPLSTAKL